MESTSRERFNVVELFHGAARSVPDQPAIIYREKAVSFSDLEHAVNQTAAHFLHKGIRKGDRVLVFVPMSDDLYRVVLALFRIGAVAVFLDEWVSVKRLADCCRLARCAAFIGTFKGRVLARLLPGLRSIPLHMGLKYASTSSLPVFPETNRDDIALITFTTGSTGTPKAAIRTHGLLFEQFQALVPLISAAPGEVCMPVLPIVLLINLGAGVTSVIADFNARKPDAMKPEKIADQIRRYRVGSIIASPFFVKQLSLYLNANVLNLNTIKRILTGGAPVFPTEASAYRNAFPEAAIGIVYGSTEAEPMSMITADELISSDTTHGLNVGKVEPAATVKIIRIIDDSIAAADDEALSALEAVPGEIGEIIVSGSHVLRDYLHNPDALKRNKIFIGTTCWHRTGDSGFWGENGNLFLTGRCASLIGTQEGLLSTFLYENRLQLIEGVEMGTIMLIRDRLTAVVELADPSRQHSVSAAMQLLPDAFGDIVFVPKIPRDPRHNSKIDYEKLRALLSRSH
ncbi:Acyl-CoA synthetase (AMP-forming)/AMP-acid ligase II [Dyadobacter soli]|uniref:Acyl-CoA synthetase (AMP-forming)/AMP-acid ligase II n=1 Tax=Dyadobacter soli TaxID=659014 RepID=A0A1G7PMW8_9BACT|nr:AMP-binding protein [Dyadobacter soli]SDF87577.1 Acyl-CoA synthetase (AMP-forming)/AMP-acid ligase II [Dyadobacter soli]